MQLAGKERMVLSTSPAETAARLKKVSHLSTEPRLWTWPYETLRLRTADSQAPQAVKDVFVMEESPFLLPGYHGERKIADPGDQADAFNDLVGRGQDRPAVDQGLSEAERKLLQVQRGEIKVSAEELQQLEQEAKKAKEQRHAAKNKRPMDVFFPLWIGRILQFRGEYGGEKGAKHYYIECRPGDDQTDEWVRELVNDFREPNQQPPVKRYAGAMLRRKQDATYWLGLISFDEHEYETAEGYFKKLTLEVWKKEKGGPWGDGARYNLARTYEAAGRTDDAIKLYETDDSPQRHGNHLRARWLREATPVASKTEKSSP